MPPFLFYNNRLHTYTSWPDCQFAQLMMASVEFGDVILSFFLSLYKSRLGWGGPCVSDQRTSGLDFGSPSFIT